MNDISINEKTPLPKAKVQTDYKDVDCMVPEVSQAPNKVTVKTTNSAQANGSSIASTVA